METDRSLASAPNTIEVVKISFPRGLFLTSIIQFRYIIRMYKIYFVLPLGGRFGLILIKSRNRKDLIKKIGEKDEIRSVESSKFP